MDTKPRTTAQQVEDPNGFAVLLELLAHHRSGEPLDEGYIAEQT